MFLLDPSEKKMQQFSISFQIKYASTNFSPLEVNPFVKCYLDGRFKRQAKNVSLIDGGIRNVTLTGTLKEGHSITTTTALCFASIAWRPNETRAACQMDTGVCHIEFGDIEREIKMNGRFCRTVPFKMNTVDQYQKAELLVNINELNLPKGIDSLISSPINRINAAEHMSSYENNVMQQEQQMEETFGPQTSNMRIPYDYSESGMQSTSVPLPAVAFVVAEVPESNDHYWVNALKTVMSRDGLKMADWHRLNIKGKARATIHTICYEAQYLDYIGDTLDRNVRGKRYNPQLVTPCENFGGNLLGSGDCEDLGYINMSDTNSLGDHVFANDCDHRDIMLEMQKIAEHYVDPLSLDVVCGAQVSDKVENYGAHCNANYIPAGKFREWMSKTREGRLIAKDINWPQEFEGSDQLPFLVGEGTGMYECYGVFNPLTPIMSYIYTCPSLEGFKKPIIHEPGKPGQFMKGSLVGLTDYFYKRGAQTPMSFWYGKVQSGGKISRGISYDEMMVNGDSPNVAIRPHPPVSSAIMALIEEYTLRRIPREPLILTKIPKDARRSHNSKLDFICKSIDQLHREKGSENDFVSVYIRPHQLLPGVCEKIVSDFTAKSRIWRVNYVLEQITDSLWGYRLNVFCHRQ